jgi:hypothetical protein
MHEIALEFPNHTVLAINASLFLKTLLNTGKYIAIRIVPYYVYA